MEDLDIPDNEALRAAAEQERLNAERTRQGDIAWLMTSPRGRRFVGWLLNTAGVNDPSFNNSGSITAFNEGRRALGLVLQTEVQRHAFSNYLVMLDEGRVPEKATK